MVQRITHILVMLCSLWLLHGCDANGDHATHGTTGSGFELQPPEYLRSLRAVTLSRLMVDVQLSYTIDGQAYPTPKTAERRGTETDPFWYVSFDVPVDTPFELIMTWYQVGEPRLDLVRLTRDIAPQSLSSENFNYTFVPESTFSIDESAADYGGFDIDADTQTNLQELLAGTNPFVNSPVPQDDPEEHTPEPMPLLSVLTGDIFESTEVQQNAIGQLNFSNVGDDLLFYDVTSDDDWIQIDTDGALEPGVSTLLLATLNCGSEPQDLSGNILLSSNAGTVNVPVTLNCIDSSATIDADGDGVLDVFDNCPSTPNPDQMDADADGIGDDCQWGCPALNLGDDVENYASANQHQDDFNAGFSSFRSSFYNVPDSSQSLQANGSSLVVRSTDNGNNNRWNIVEVRPTDFKSDHLNLVFKMLDESAEVLIESGNANSPSSHVKMVGTFFNIFDDSGTDDQVGDVTLNIQFRNNQANGHPRVFMCANYLAADGRRLGLFDELEDGHGETDGCSGGDMVGLGEFIKGLEYNVDIGVDRDRKVVFFQLNDKRVELPFSQPVYDAKKPYMYVQTIANGEGVQAVAELIKISTSTETGTNLSRLVNQANYRNHPADTANNLNRDLSIRNGQLVLGINSTEVGNFEGAGLNLLDGDLDYLQADIELSSETNIEAGEDSGIRVSGSMYNSIQSRGVNGTNEGDNWASINLFVNSTGIPKATYCVFRQLADNQGCPIRQEGMSGCTTFPGAVEFDKLYRTSIDLDRTNRTMTFRFGDETAMIPVIGRILLPAVSHDKAVNVRMRAVGNVSAFADNFTTIR